MFACPSVASSEPEGASDDNPIRLQGDSVEEARALMWSLYALCVSRSVEWTISLRRSVQAARGAERLEQRR